jgi:hypothetical protein
MTSIALQLRISTHSRHSVLSSRCVASSSFVRPPASLQFQSIYSSHSIFFSLHARPLLPTWICSVVRLYIMECGWDWSWLSGPAHDESKITSWRRRAESARIPGSERSCNCEKCSLRQKDAIARNAKVGKKRNLREVRGGPEWAFCGSGGMRLAAQLKTVLQGGGGAARQRAIYRLAGAYPQKNLALGSLALSIPGNSDKN